MSKTEQEAVEKVALAIATASEHFSCIEKIPQGQCSVSDLDLPCACRNEAKAAIAAMPSSAGIRDEALEEAARRADERKAEACSMPGVYHNGRYDAAYGIASDIRKLKSKSPPAEN